ncbi:MAG: hypothetical protein F6J89_33600, partial [Symploca sp. SIO1C4]|nr:hypothetical protein [Symploca sp. SIO1C4]
DGQYLVSGGVDQTVRLWSIEQARCLHVLEGHRERVWAVAFSADGQQVVSCSADETIRLWDVASGDCLLTLAVERPYERMNIWGATGITEAQRETLFSLGAVEEEGNGSQRAQRSH